MITKMIKQKNIIIYCYLVLGDFRFAQNGANLKPPNNLKTIMSISSF
jgi:hypothetical protein